MLVNQTPPLLCRAISTSPRAFEVVNFLSEYECDYLVEKHRPRMTASQTGNGENARVEAVHMHTHTQACI